MISIVGDTIYYNGVTMGYINAPEGTERTEFEYVMERSDGLFVELCDAKDKIMEKERELDVLSRMVDDLNDEAWEINADYIRLMVKHFDLQTELSVAYEKIDGQEHDLRGNG